MTDFRQAVERARWCREMAGKLGRSRTLTEAEFLVLARDFDTLAAALADTERERDEARKSADFITLRDAFNESARLRELWYEEERRRKAAEAREARIRAELDLVIQSREAAEARVAELEAWPEYECPHEHRWRSPDTKRCPGCGTITFRIVGVSAEEQP